MARWKPNPSQRFGPAEHIGRRLFDEPQLVGASNQKTCTRLDIRNFEETRGDEFSVDRLGRTSIEKSVTAYLKCLADTAGRTFQRPKAFDGWAVVPIKKINSPARGAPLPLVASPENDNPYHAHLLTTDVPVNSGVMRYYFVALHLRELFEGPGSILHPAQAPQSESLSANPEEKLASSMVWFQKLMSRVRNLFAKRR